jgi:putative endonuclease
MKAFYVYMMTNRSRVVLYTGITNSLMRQASQHQNGEIEGFTKTYKVNRLVYYERFNDPRDAIAREKEIKGWRREKKNALVETMNPKVGGFIADALSAYERSVAPLGTTKENT